MAENLSATNNASNNDEIPVDEPDISKLFQLPSWLKRNKKEESTQTADSHQVDLDELDDSKHINKIPTVQLEDEDYYNFSNKNRGFAIIFNHYKFKHDNCVDRNGTQKDAQAMKQTLETLKFDVTICQDLTFKQIKNKINNVSKTDHSDNDCLVIVVMTHGETSNMLIANDMPYDFKEIWEPFVGDNCPSLVGKPKLFFINACRGANTDPGVMANYRTEHDSGVAVPSQLGDMKMPSHADILFMFSTQIDHYSFRHPENGSYFIQALCGELLKRAKKGQDILTILTFVNRNMAYNFYSNALNIEIHDKKQVGSIVSSLTRLLRFKK